jgi:hypothetical protein
MNKTRLYRGILAMTIGALALWKGVAAAEVASVDRREAVTVRGESDALLASIPLGQVLVKMSCVGKDAKAPCNNQLGVISNACFGRCQGQMCVMMSTGLGCSFCHPAAKAEIKNCIKSSTFNCYSGAGATVTCGPKTKGTLCVTFKDPSCQPDALCAKACKDTGLLDGACPNLRDGCLGNANP